jgi:hypothetical protein
LTQGHGVVGRVRAIKKSKDLIGKEARDFSSCRIGLKQLSYSLPHGKIIKTNICKINCAMMHVVS